MDLAMTYKIVSLRFRVIALLSSRVLGEIDHYRMRNILKILDYTPTGYVSGISKVSCP